MANQISLTANQLIQLYLVMKQTPMAIAKQFGCSEGTIRKRLIALGVPLRSGSEARRLLYGIEITEFKLRHWYIDERQSADKIAKRLGCSSTTVRRRLTEFGIPIRSDADTPLKFVRHDFDGTNEQKAYLLGFRQGDLRVSYGKLGGKSKTIRVEASSTHSEQISLFRLLFSQYGHIWESIVRRNERQDLVCYLNLSFSFLVPKQDRVEDWIICDSVLMAAFVAGYVDAEGSFGFNKGDPAFAIDSYDKHTLHTIHKWCMESSVVCPSPHIVRPKGSYNSGAKTSYAYDLWRLALYRKRSLFEFISMLSPFILHARRRQDMERVWNVVSRK